MGRRTSVDTVTITVNADNDASNGERWVPTRVDCGEWLGRNAGRRRGSTDPENQTLTYTWVQDRRTDGDAE